MLAICPSCRRCVSATARSVEVTTRVEDELKDKGAKPVDETKKDTKEPTSTASNSKTADDTDKKTCKTCGKYAVYEGEGPVQVGYCCNKCRDTNGQSHGMLCISAAATSTSYYWARTPPGVGARTHEPVLRIRSHEQRISPEKAEYDSSSAAASTAGAIRRSIPRAFDAGAADR